MVVCRRGIGAWALVIATAWHGGELVYRHGLGVLSLPVAEADHVHSHEHGIIPDGEAHAHVDETSEDQAHEHTH